MVTKKEVEESVMEVVDLVFTADTTFYEKFIRYLNFFDIATHMTDNKERIEEMKNIFIERYRRIFTGRYPY